MDWKEKANTLLEEFDLCCKARPCGNPVDVELAKTSCQRFAYQLATQRSWGTDVEIAEACYQLEPRLKQLKEKVIMDILHNGPI